MDNNTRMKIHARFLQKNLRNARENFSVYEPIRPTILFFMVSGLDIVDSLNKLSAREKSEICDWIYSQQIEPRSGFNDNVEELKKCGFYGSRTLILTGNYDKSSVSDYIVGHIAMTYSCLLTLVILGDDLSRVNKNAILRSLGCLQNNDGSFLSSLVCGETDLRFVYCAIVICYLLDDFTHINVESTVRFVLNCICYDGGIALEPNLESHGGSSFCGLAILSLLERLNSLSSKQQKKLQRWLIMRQESGFQGRTHKQVDSCYSFWIGAALKILDSYDYVDQDKNREFLLLCENKKIGGFSKNCHLTVDLTHTYFGLYGLSFMNEQGLNEMHPTLNMSLRAYNHLKTLHNSVFK